MIGEYQPRMVQSITRAHLLKQVIKGIQGAKSEDFRTEKNLMTKVMYCVASVTDREVRGGQSMTRRQALPATRLMDTKQMGQTE